MSSAVGRQRPASDNPWVCPSDRQLALRAKLKSGWSVKTSSLQVYRRPAPLDEHEHHAIVGVIQKAETFEKKEQLRIGKLVDRLENMRRHAVGNGVSTCVLCGEKFGLLGSTKHKCKDCLKAVCQKCVVDTSSAAGEPWLLCKICAETREVWKKSGAWFFKSMPRYVVPEAKRPQLSNGTRLRVITAAPSPEASLTRYSWAKHVQPDTNGGATIVARPPRTSDDSLSSAGRRHSAADSDSSDEDVERPRSAVRRVTTYERVAPLVAR